jgi:hypothetical protein
MFRIFGLTRAGLALVALVTLTGVTMITGQAHAVVYCKTVGVPRGCVVRPVVRAPVAGPVVYCRTVGVPKGCIMRR